MQHQTFSLERSSICFFFKESGSLVLTSGQASAYGAPLKRNVRYQFSTCGVPLEIATTATLDVEGHFTFKEGVLSTAIYSMHTLLEANRESVAVQYQRQFGPGSHEHGEDEDLSLFGPRVIVIGDQNTGKTSLCRTLVNLGVRSKQHGITYVDVDVGQHSITCPGSVSACFTEAPLPVDDGFSPTMPLSFFFGDKSVDTTSRKRYLDLCAELAQAVESVGRQRVPFRTGGTIINTMGWATDLGRDLLIELCSIFSVTDVIVCGADSELEEAMRSAAAVRSGVRVLRYPKLDHVAPRGGKLLSAARTMQLATYFVGTPRSPLRFVRQVARIDEVVFLHSITLQAMSWKEVAVNRLAAVVWADSAEQAASANVAGFIVLLEVGKSFFSFASPSPSPLPKPFLLVSPTFSIRLERFVSANNNNNNRS